MSGSPQWSLFLRFPHQNPIHTSLLPHLHYSGSVTTAWRVLGLRMEEQPPIWRVAANILNKQSRTADKGCSSILGVGWGANHSSLWKQIFVTKYLQIYFYWIQYFLYNLQLLSCRIFSTFMDTKYSLACLQKLTWGPHPMPRISNMHTLIPTYQK
jgi:hypothetical protein